MENLKLFLIGIVKSLDFSNVFVYRNEDYERIKRELMENDTSDASNDKRNIYGDFMNIGGDMKKTVNKFKTV